MARNIFVLLDTLTTTIADLRTALAPLAALSAPAAVPAPRRPPGPTRPPARRSVSSKPTAPTPRPKVKRRTAAQRLHVQYLTALKKLPAAEQAQVKKARASDGPEAALTLATSLAK
jgi:hypothetical protein